jgi:hypothetical protein
VQNSYMTALKELDTIFNFKQFGPVSLMFNDCADTT